MVGRVAGMLADLLSILGSSHFLAVNGLTTRWMVNRSMHFRSIRSYAKMTALCAACASFVHNPNSDN